MSFMAHRGGVYVNSSPLLCGFVEQQVKELESNSVSDSGIFETPRKIRSTRSWAYGGNDCIWHVSFC